MLILSWLKSKAIYLVLLIALSLTTYLLFKSNVNNSILEAKINQIESEKENIRQLYISELSTREEINKSHRDGVEKVNKELKTITKMLSNLEAQNEKLQECLNMELPADVANRMFGKGGSKE